MIWQLDQISEKDINQVGGKACSLARMMREGIRIPAGICIGTEVYDEFVSSSGLRELIFMELSRKKFDEMRWEEIWDASLRIRNKFVNTSIPARISDELKRVVSSQVGSNPVVIRSSAPGEDAATTSFAGLHESYVNIREGDSIVEHIRLVWASLWSDRALLYRRDLGLNVETSTMAVVIQKLVNGERSGVVFGMNPNDDSQGIIEAVHGLNQGLVDGTVEPDRWIVGRETGTVISHSPARREKAMVPSEDGVKLKSLPGAISAKPPLNPSEARKVFALARRAEDLFHAPQDVEWTFRSASLYALQSRPITTGRGDTSGDKRPWYMSLTRSFENLKRLRERIENQLIPAMIEEADRLAERDIAGLTDPELGSEIKRRMRILAKWEQTYEDEFIPFAHGARLFGQVYNDTMHPSDPHEFTDLLGGTNMASVQRNEMLAEMAETIRRNPPLDQQLRNRDRAAWESEFGNLFDMFMEKFGEFTFSGAHSEKNRERVIDLLLEMASRESAKKRFGPDRVNNLAEKFLSRFPADKKQFAAELLELGRASYQLRDDDNIHLGRIESRLHAAVREGRSRITARGRGEASWFEPGDVAKALTDSSYRPRGYKKASQKEQSEQRLRARQIVGQPAGPGIGTGTARVLTNPSDLFDFKAGEILVCDSIDPNMTFIVPLAAGIVERRGGMLIHGAIVAREYGIPCVTGVPDATSMIHTGQQVTVDGFLGIVVIGKPTLTTEDSPDDMPGF